MFGNYDIRLRVNSYRMENNHTGALVVQLQLSILTRVH